MVATAVVVQYLLFDKIDILSRVNVFSCAYHQKLSTNNFVVSFSRARLCDVNSLINKDKFII